MNLEHKGIAIWSSSSRRSIPFFTRFKRVRMSRSEADADAKKETDAEADEELKAKTYRNYFHI